jgi:hypothetical protein
METSADFDIVFEEGVPYGYARTTLGKQVYGEAVLRMLDIDAEHFWTNVPDNVIVAVVCDGEVHYPTKYRLQ